MSLSLVEENDREGVVEPKMKRARQSETEGNEDRLSDLPDCLILHMMSFLSTKDAVRTLLLSRRWNDLWKYIPTLKLHSSDFRTLKIFDKFMSRVLSLRDSSVAVHNLDFERNGCIGPRLLKRIVAYAISHNVQHLGISITCDSHYLPPSIFSCHTLTSLKLSVFPKGYWRLETLFPKSLNLTALTNLHLQRFAFCKSNHNRVEPFSTCSRLNTLFIEDCSLCDAELLCISSTTLANLTIRSSYLVLDIYKIVLSTPNLRSFAFTGFPCQQLSESNLPFLQQVNIDAETWSSSLKLPSILFGWLQELGNVKSLTVSSSTLQVLFLIPDLLKIKLPFLGNLKSLKVKLKPDSPESWSASELKPSDIPDGIVDFLLQNSPSAEVSVLNC